MADRPHYLEQFAQQIPEQPTSVLIAYGIGLLYLVHQVLVYCDYPGLAPTELLWNAIVYSIPQRLLLDRVTRQELHASDMLSQTHAAKSEALRKLLGFSSASVLQSLPSGGQVLRRFSSSMKVPDSDAPPGLGNWDNSCYQNSILQGLSSLPSLRMYLERYSDSVALPAGSTSAALQELTAKLSDGDNNGKQLWTPAKLKSMSSWQQQDAQEYFSKIVEELEKEAAKVAKAEEDKSGLETAVHEADDKADICVAHDSSTQSKRSQNPLEGLLAQRVACTSCGFSEGLSMIPFNCLTLPLGSEYEYSLGQCLDEYTKLEHIDQVECPKCTLLRAKGQMEAMLPSSTSSRTSDNGSSEPGVDENVFALPPAIRAQIAERLEAINDALERNDYADKTLTESCKIPKKARVSGTKTRQAVVGRAPQNLVVHVNRSVFDELTGAQRKNYASVRFPVTLDLGRWSFSAEAQDDNLLTSPHSMQSLLENPIHQDKSELYRLKAVITHYGRHENGHYIAYRQHPPQAATLKEDTTQEGEILRSGQQSSWWRLSDEDVSPVSEADMLAQGGVFMLFYERDNVAGSLPPTLSAELPVIEQAPAKSEEEQVAVTAMSVRSEHSSVLPVDTKATDAEPAAAKIAFDTPEQPQSTLAKSEEEPAPTEPHSEATTEDESETEPLPPVQPIPRRRTPPTMRTARQGSSGSESGFVNAFAEFRPMAAT